MSPRTIRRVGRLCLLSSLVLYGCSKTPPQNLPAHFEGNVVIDAGNVMDLDIDWTQNGAQLTGTYHYGEYREPGEVVAVSAGDQLNVTLKVPPEAQKAKGFPAELNFTATVGNVSVDEVRRRYSSVLESQKLPDYLKPGMPPLVQLGGFLDFKANDRPFHRIVNLTNCTLVKDLTAGPAPRPGPK